MDHRAGTVGNQYGPSAMPGARRKYQSTTRKVVAGAAFVAVVWALSNVQHAIWYGKGVTHAMAVKKRSGSSQAEI